MREKRYLQKQRMKLKQYNDDSNDYASPKEVADILKNMRFNK